MPHKGLVERGYKAKIYQTHGAATMDLIRVGGTDVEGSFVVLGPGGRRRAAARRATPSKALGMQYKDEFEKANGKGSAQPVRRAMPTTSSSCCRRRCRSR